MYAIGVMGFFMRRYDFPIAPVILGVILGPLMETQARRALTASGDDFGVFFGRPLTVILLMFAVAAFIVPHLRRAARALVLRRGLNWDVPSQDSQGSSEASLTGRAEAGRMSATTHDGVRVAARSRARARAVALPRPELVALLVLAGALNLWALSRNGWANEYYAGAVRSMAAGWHAFLYGSLDAAGVMTVDKPPMALWVQALSVRVFGWSSWSMLVPQALMGVASVGLVYDLTRRRFGRAGGFVAGAVLALTPIAVAVSRHNNPDALLVLCVVGALWAVVRGLEDGRVRWLVLAGACVGLGFETKMGAALLVVPALAVAWLWAAPRDRVRGLLGGGRGDGRRRRCLAAAGGADAGFVAPVDLGHVGQQHLVADHRLQRPRPARRPGRRAAGVGAAVGGGGVFGGSAGPLRLLNDALGGQAGWLLGFALVAGLALVVSTRLRRGGPGDGLAARRRRLRADRRGRVLAAPRASSTRTTSASSRRSPPRSSAPAPCASRGATRWPASPARSRSPAA